MRRPLCAFILSLSLVAGPALAGPYSDELAKCLVKSTTPADKTLLVQWMFATMSLHPAVKQIGTVSPAERARINQKVADLIERLLTNSCLSDAQDAVAYEGQGTIESSFSVLGQVAARELFANPEVAKGTSEFAKRLDEAKLKKALTAKR